MTESLNISGPHSEASPEAAKVELSEAERKQLLVTWNQTAAAFPRHWPAHELFARQAARTPDAVAVIGPEGQLTYRELDVLANRLAHKLIAQGVKPETLVGVCVERSPAMIVALLGVWKAGGAFVPLNPHYYPPARLAEMLQDCQAAVLLTHGSLREAGREISRQAGTGCQVLDLEEADLAPGSGEILPPEVAVAPNHLAYVIFTSGSTGQPKGVMVEHHSLVNHLHWRQQTFPVDGRDAFLQKASLSFDIAIWEIFAPLMFGARLVLAKPEGQKDAAYLVQLMRRQKVTLAHFGPALLQMVVAEPEFPQCAALRQVFCGGEPLPGRLQELFFARSAAELISQYGPTETTVDVTWCRCERNAILHPAPIGRPIANTRIYLLNERREPVPVGAPGEIYVGGESVARGYLNRPELTAEKFVPDPFGPEPGARLYQTGDLARYRPDGRLEFLGRRDYQIKLRGYRVELGEIEAVIRRFPGVGQCAAITQEYPPGEQRLVACVTPADPASPPDWAALKTALKQKLPDYMIPAVLVPLAALPLTANGKIDRKALPLPDSENSADRREITPPATPTEKRLAEIWRETLGVKAVGINENFYDLGGHSLLAMRLALRVREAFKIELPARWIAEAPTLRELARRLDDAATTKTPPERPALPPEVHVEQDAQGNRRAPASFNQAQLWFIQQLDSESTVYNQVKLLRLKGPLNLPALRASLNELFRRHEALRTTFTAKAGEPWQVIAPPGPVSLAVTELSGLPSAEREEEVTRLAAQEASQPFDLQQGPLVRLRLLTLSEQDHVLLFAVHHIIWDGWSAEIVLRELGASYAAFSAGQTPALPDLPLQYADYAAWQRQQLTEAQVAGHLAYWRSQLAGAPMLLELPLDRARGSVRRSRGGQHRFRVGPELAGTLRRLGQAEEGTLFMVLLAAFHALLHRYARQEQVLVGVPFAGRTSRDVEGVVGFFVNALPVKGELGGDPAFKDLLRQVRDAVWGVQGHQELPFERLVREWQPVREAHCNPIFQVCMVQEVTPPIPNPVPGLTIEFDEREPAEAMFDLTLSVTELNGEVDCVLRYNADLFSAGMVARLVNGYEQLLAAVAAEPQRRVSELPLMDAAERRRLVVDWNQTAMANPHNACVHELFEAQAAKTPDLPAVACGDRQLTYRELNERANQLAHRLRELGVQPDSLVGLYLGKAVEFVIAVLGTLKAGGAYVPLDPDLPEDRIRFMIEDAHPVAVISLGEVPGGALPEGVKALRLDAPDAALNAAAKVNPPVVNGPENLAYVLYTSGSTGKPKGVLMPHRALINLIHWQLRHSTCQTGHRTLQFASVGFDVCFQEIFATLTVGGAVVIPAPEERRDFVRLVQLMEQARVNRLFLPFVALDNLAGVCRETDLVPQSLREIITAGEQLRSTPALRELFKRLNGARLVNQYGPTESHVVSAFELELSPDEWLPLPPIGKPIDNVQLYVVDARLEPVPAGVAGELVIGGIQVARGYLNRPELTAEKFVPDRLGPEPGRLLYRTGDLVRYGADGNLEFLARMDHQVKVRGYRVELGEIEAVLGRHPAIRECAVIAQPGPGGGKDLIAYLTVKELAAPTVMELRDFLLKELPEYMLPSAYVNLEKLPVNTNGKVDRKQLPALGAKRLGAGTEYTAPQTPTEAALARVWSELIGVERVGIHDNFFALGGHSLMAVRLNFRIHEEFKVELPLRQITECPTVAQQSRLIAAAKKEAAEAAAEDSTQIRRMRTSDTALARRSVASFGQEQLWFIHQLEPASSVYNLPLVLRLRGALNLSALQQSLNHLIGRHSVLRTIFSVENDAPTQVILPEIKLDLPAASLEAVPAAEREAHLQQCLREVVDQPFDLHRGPLLRGKLFCVKPDEHVLLQVIHHIIWDGWSAEIFLRELGISYAAFSAGRTPALPDLPLQYADYAAWQRQQLTEAQVAGHLAYWRSQLAGAPMLLELPLDRARGSVRRSRGGQHRFRVGPELAGTLRRLGQAEEGTLFMVLLAAFHALLHRYARQEQVLVGVPFAGRTSRDVEGVVGFFVNALPVKGELGGDPAFKDLLRQVRDAVWGVQGHQELPFERLVREWQPVREAHCNPIFQVCMVYELAAEEPCRMPGLQVELHKMPPTEAMFDLLLAVMEADGELECSLQYNTDLFEAETVARLAGAYERLLAAVAAEPQRRVSELPLMDAAERRRLVVEWNQTAVDYPRHACIHELFEAQAEKTPAATALELGRERLTYRELNERANQLAHRLRELGVKAETFVGVHVNRSIDYVICCLGVLKAGGAYVPLDTDYPAQRLQFMLQDSGAKIVITKPPLPKGFDTGQTMVLDLAKEAAALRTGARGNLHAAVKAEQPAYVIYTSGSTGKPKGSIIPHRGVVRLVRGQRYAEFNVHQRFLLLASTSFDATTFEMWGPLLNGAVCVIFPRQLLHFAELEKWVRQHGITCLWLTTGLFNQIVDTHPAALASVPHVLVGGEALSVPHVKKALELMPRLRLTNGYGPTESTTFACTFEIKPETPLAHGTVPIGRPIANTQCFVLDAHQQPVPVGVAGELYLGGDGLARGYLNRPELTAEKFIPNPFSAEPGQRLYRTGDLVRYGADGNLEFLGRLDQQVKIRGYRIELGEIEIVLGRHPAIRECAVVARVNPAGGKDLVAYLVVREAAPPTVPELRDFLLQELPEYMVPTAYVNLKRLPLNENGKVDRRALPSPEAQRLSLGVEHTEPRTPLETSLAKIWSGLLGVEHVGTHDNFFALGGHSLMAARLVNEIRRQMRFDLPIRLLFQYPTIHEQAKILQDQKLRERKPELMQLNVGHLSSELYFLIDEGSLGLFKLAHYLNKDHSIYASVVPLSEAALKASARRQFDALPSMEASAAEHTALIQTRRTTGPVLLAGHCYGGMLAFEVARQLQAAGTTVAGVLIMDTWMAPPSRWWERKAWLREHFGKLLKQGPKYVMDKFRRRVQLQQQDLADRLDLAIRNDYNMHVPWAVIERIYTHAIRYYQPQPLPLRGVLLVSREDWVSNAYRPVDNTLGAARVFTGGVDVVDVPGNHVTILDEEYLPELARHFNQSLEQFR